MKSCIYVQNSPLAWTHGIWYKYLSQFCIYSAMPAWGNVCMNPASPGLLAQHHPLNKWLLWISSFQMQFTLSAAQMMPAGLGDMLKYSDTFSCICHLLPQLLLVCLTQNWNLVQRIGRPGKLLSSRCCKGLVLSSQPVWVWKEQAVSFRSSLKELCEVLMKTMLKCWAHGGCHLFWLTLHVVTVFSDIIPYICKPWAAHLAASMDNF